MGDARVGLDQPAELPVGEVDGVGKDRPLPQPAGTVVDVDVVEGVWEEPPTSAISTRSSETCVCHQAPVARARSADSRSISGVHEIANRGVTAYPSRPSSTPCQRSIRSANSRIDRSRIVHGSIVGS